MTTEILLVLVILGIAILLFVSERLRVDLVTDEEAFSGFASPEVIPVWPVYIISRD